jgi:hypothetical protein
MGTTTASSSSGGASAAAAAANLPLLVSATPNRRILLHPTTLPPPHSTPLATAATAVGGGSGGSGVDTSGNGLRLPLPRAPRESAQAALMIQLLSDRPRTASARSAAHGSLWLLCLHERMADLAELGAAAGLKYEVSFNQHGARFAFVGLSQSLAEYTAVFASALGPLVVATPGRDGSSGGGLGGGLAGGIGGGVVGGSLGGGSGRPLPIDEALAQLSHAPAPGWSSGWQKRRRKVADALRAARPEDVRAEGAQLWRSVEGSLVLAQGDLLPPEAIALADNFARLAGTPRPSMAAATAEPIAWPPLQSVLYPPRWRPARAGDPCLLPGVQLVADACGRVPR